MKHPCVVCSVHINNSGRGLICSSCNLWCHSSCATISDDLYEQLGKGDPDDRVHFFCPKCNPVALIDELKRLRITCSGNDGSAPSSVISHLEKVERNLDDLTKILGPLLGEQTFAVPPADASSAPTRKSYASVASKNAAPGKIVTVADLQSVQKADLDNRSIVMVGLLERGTDSNDVSELIKAIDPSAGAVECYRMGNVTGNEDKAKPRLLKVVLPSATVARSVLQAAHKLKESVRFRSVFIRKSMSREERLLMVKLHSQRKEFNKQAKEDGVNTKFVIVNEKLLKYVNCELLEDGRLGRGVLDRSFRFDNVSSNVGNGEKGAEKEGRPEGDPNN